MSSEGYPRIYSFLGIHGYTVVQVQVPSPGSWWAWLSHGETPGAQKGLPCSPSSPTQVFAHCTVGQGHRTRSIRIPQEGGGQALGKHPESTFMDTDCTPSRALLPSLLGASQPPSKVVHTR